MRPRHTIGELCRKFVIWSAMFVLVASCQKSDSNADGVTPAGQCRLKTMTVISKDPKDATELTDEKVEYRYGLNNRLESLKTTSEGEDNSTLTLKYNTDGYVERIEQVTEEDGKITGQTTYTMAYSGGRLAEWLNEYGGLWFTYDSEGRLATYRWKWKSDVDEAKWSNGVLVAYSETFLGSTDVATITDGRITQFGSTRYVYDSKGRLTKGETTVGSRKGYYTLYEYDDFMAQNNQWLPWRQLKGWSSFQPEIWMKTDYAIRREQGYKLDGTPETGLYASFVYLNKANSKGYLTEQIGFRGTDPTTDLKTVSYSRTTYDFVGCN